MSRPRILGLILAGGKGERLYPLTKDRSTPSWEEEEFLRAKEAQDFCFPELAEHIEAAAKRGQGAMA